ncbi:hypothetical protein PQI66_15045 [Corynebacterium sp. USCH3]|uniref:hypothetical protein n=1 Tax=Corynebacterium sp. USCH3 TaxID=3024840 RepID=UPI0030A31EA7
MNRPTLTTVRHRRQFSLLGDIGIACIILAAALRFRWDGLSELRAVVGIFITAVSCDRLRRSIRRQDVRHEEELDEYELLRRHRAHRTALRWAIAFLVTLWTALIVLLAIFNRQGAESFETFLDAVVACLYCTTAFMLFIPFLILRTIANGMNKDLLISGDDNEEVHTS